MTALLQEQKAYFEARCTEYDEGRGRSSRYDLGPGGNVMGREEIRRVGAVFDTTPLRGHILEHAAGTGSGTPYLGPRAEQVTLLEASHRMIGRIAAESKMQGYFNASSMRKQIFPAHGPKRPMRRNLEA